MNRYVLCIMIVFFLLNCSKKKELFNKDFEKTLEAYIKKNPLDLSAYSIDKEKYSYPSYHVFFNKKNNDTVFSILKFPHLTNYEINLDEREKGSEIIYNQINCKGVEYINDYPVFFFDKKNLGHDFINYKNLIKKIGDSLKLKKEAYHINPSRQDYIISKGKIK